MLDKRQRKRILIFLVIPILAAGLFISNDLIIRLIIIALLVIYVAFIIFLRDSVRFSGGYSISEAEDTIPESVSSQHSEAEESFRIVSKNKNIDVITEENYKPEYGVSKTTLKPPDLKERFEEIAKETLPPGIGHDEQFGFVIERMLNVMAELYNAHSVIYFWHNKKKEKLIIEKFISSSRQLTKRKFDIEDDVLSKIVEKGEPELLTDISRAAEADVIRYYDTPQGIKSFAGAPVFYNEELIAIIAIDSKVEDAFGIETIYSLGRFIRLITMLIGIFEEKYSDTVSQKRLEGLLKILGPDSEFENEKELINALPETLRAMIKWDAFVFIYFDPLEKLFKIEKVENTTALKYVGVDLQIDLNGTLVGKSIVTGIPIKIDDTSSGNYKRYSRAEDVSFDGSFIAIPLIYSKQNYGVICLESLKKNAYSNQDVQFLKKSLNVLAYIIYSHSSQKLLRNLTSVDLETRALNATAFKERLNADLVKAKQLDVPGTLALLKIDDFIEQNSLFEDNPLSKVVSVVSEIISEEMTPLNLFGRLDDRLFGIYFFNASTKNVFLWAEKLRVKIARKPISVISKQTTFTVSIGVASTTNKDNVDEVIHNANLALNKAIEKGGNSVLNIN
ncbi:MAG: GAF domain-containing protein [Ignavibacteriaceae bacterium]|jgi:diguanylate cyclase (GGDEF)-like protein|nr:GAF domain-containing protein [Ignavibacteriaceae bacterium]MCW8811917.1 GAF domain-containing protein [Chlorobium sp.]MCW8818036.1 GAF domain-containing protein [Ignavibacteriaceae bacterium]MCW9095566.1 GAF domain-containing protein [Ignavibacteriaceae bacterium]MCW9098241.1 GAF domain-containing protein [Ignavibacteriaceae bacterium]